MYDCSSPRTPHMVYTDHTYLTCTEYPDYGRAAWNPVRPDWLIDLERTIFGNAACILTMSRNVTRTLLDRYRIPASKVSCVRIGCNASLQRILQIPCELRRYRAKAILFAGMEWERKGGEQLLDAFRAVRHQVPDARLVLAGRHPDIRQENVQVVPPVPLEQIPDLMANASIFCLPSRLEPFGIAWLEAMAAGLPVIGLNLGAAPDFIRPDQTGVLVEPDDIDGLARALVDLLANPKKCCTLGQAGRALVTSDYTWSQTCRAIAVHMDHAVAARGRTLADCPSM